MASPEFFVEYFTRPAALAFFGVLLGTAVLSFLLFIRARRSHTRIVLLSVVFGACLVFWLFVISSFMFCEAYDHIHPNLPLMEMKVVMGWASAFALAMGVPLAAALSLRGSSTLTRDLLRGDSPDERTLSTFLEVRELMGIPEAELVSVRTSRPVCFSIGGREKKVVISENLHTSLSDDEFRSIVAHELSHLKSGDTRIKALLAAYTRILKFDPILRLIKAATAREMEYRADELVARTMGSPNPLAAALSKLRCQQRRPMTAVSPLGSHLFASHPSIQARISRLLKLERDL